MRKFIVSTIMVIVLTGTILCFLSSCAYFTGQDDGAVKSAAFVGNVVYKQIDTNPVDAESHYMMGCHFQKRHKHQWAIKEFQTAIHNNPAYVEAYNRLGVSYDLLGEFDRAVAAYTAALSINPDLDYVHNNLGYSYLLQERYDRAVASFQKAISLNPEKVRYHNNLGMAYAKSGQEQAAIATFKTRVGEAEAHVTMAQVYYHDGEYKKAEDYFAKASRLKPRDIQSEKGLAAAANLAEIHTRSETVAKPIEKPVAQTQPAIPNRYDKDGFYTIPAEEMAEFDNNEVVVVSITESNLVDEVPTEETPYFISAVAPLEPSDSVKQAIHEKVNRDTRQLLEESEVRDLIGENFEMARPDGPKRIRIEVSNGNGVRHMALQVGHFIQDQTLILMYLSNADHFNYGRTSIYYTSGSLQEALRVAQKLPGLQQMQEKDMLRDGNADISILIGQDLVPYLDAFKDS